MGVFSSRASIWLICCLVISAISKNRAGSSSPITLKVCKKYDFYELELIGDKQCRSDGNLIEDSRNSLRSRVVEVNVTTLERVLNILQARDGAHAAVLFYADWCPFSRALRPMFDTLSSAFPSVYHFVVKDSALQPSVLPQFGVHSYPVLFLHNKTAKVRYHGSRTIEALSQFYRDITGQQPSSKGDETTLLNKQHLDKTLLDRENWQRSGENWLYDDIYLTLATVFLAVRLFIYLLPKLSTGMRYYWTRNRTLRRAHRGLLRKMLSRDADQEQLSKSSRESKNTRKETTQERGKGVLSMPSWSSSSLAAVTLAEGSSSRSGAVDTVCEGNALRRG